MSSVHKQIKLYRMTLRICALLVFWSLGITGLSDARGPKFGSSIAVLQVDALGGNLTEQPQRLNYDISPSGDYVVARTVEFHRDNRPYASTLYVWDTQGLEWDQDVIHVEPSYRRDLPASPSRKFFISPDDQLVAVELDDEILLLTLPELDDYRSWPINPSDRVREFRWNPQTLLMGITLGSQIVVWDVEEHIIYQHEWLDGSSLPLLIAAETGWIQYRGMGNTFQSCDVYLEACETYEKFGPLTVSPSGELMLTERWDPAIQRVEIGIWEYQRGSGYSLEIIAPRTEPPLSGLFFISPTGKYVYSTRYDVVWDWETRTVVNSPGDRHTPLWLPGDRYFVAGDLSAAPYATFKLYRFGEQEPLDEFVLQALPELDWIYETSELHQLYDIGAGAKVSESGNAIFVSLGWVAVLIPIEYQ